MATILRYFISGANPDLLDMSTPGSEFVLTGQQIITTGGGAVNTLHAALGVDLDARNMLGGEDVVVFNYRWDQYTKDITTISGAIVFNYTDSASGLSEKVTVLNGSTTLGRDKLIFSDGSVLTQNAKSALTTSLSVSLTAVPAYNAGTTTATFVFPTPGGNTLRGFASTTNTNGQGAIFALGDAGQTLITTGSGQVDKVYAKAGSIVDARNLLGGEDIIYLTGSWASYTKSLTAVSGAIQLTRSVNGLNEVVTVLNGSTTLGRDKLVFADGAILTQNARTALQTNLSAALTSVTGYDLAIKTPFLNASPTGDVIIEGAVLQGQALRAANTLADADGLGTISYQWKAAGVAINGATGNTFTLTEAQVGKAITVTASYTDAKGTAESVTSVATAAVQNVNDPIGGSLTITGTPTQGQTLVVNDTVTDPDGKVGTIYTWFANGSTQIGTGTSLILGQDQVGKTISVRASYQDNYGVNEIPVFSASTAAVTNIDDAAEGTLSISGVAQEGATLVANVSGLSDLDSFPAQPTILYQWQENTGTVGTPQWVNLQSAGNTLLVPSDQSYVGKVVRVVATSTDALGGNTIFTSAASTIANVNDAPTGSVIISGTAQSEQVLTASNTLVDADGIGAITYNWFANGIAESLGSGSNLVLTDALIGKQISVRASYIDGAQTNESVTSAATATVTASSVARTIVLTDGANIQTSTGNVTYVVDASQSISASINGFGIGDSFRVINPPAGANTSAGVIWLGDTTLQLAFGNAIITLPDAASNAFIQGAYASNGVDETDFLSSVYGFGANAISYVIDPDQTSPTISGITLSATGSQNNYLNAGDTITATVILTEAVVVTGVPQLGITIGNTPVQASYLSGSGSNTLKFTYAVISNQVDTDGISISANSISLNNGTIKDFSSNDLTLTHAEVLANDALKVDASLPVFSSSSAASISENIGFGQVIYTAVASDDSNLSYSIKQGAGDFSQFSIVNNLVSLIPNPDYETKASYSFTIVAVDAAGNSREQLVNLSVTNVNEAPSNNVPSLLQLTEDVPKVIDGLSISDVDSSAGFTVTLSATNGTLAVITGSGVVINGSGTATVVLTGEKAAINTLLASTNAVIYTPTTNYSGTSTLTMVTSDGQNSDNDTVSLNIASVNDAPTAIALSANTIAESVTVGSGVEVGTLIVTDPDVSGNNNILSIEGVDSSSFTTANNKLIFVGSSPNFELKSSYSIVVKATDGGVTYSQPFTINVTDINEVPTAVALTNSTSAITENTSTSSRIKVADIVITDDALGTETLTLTGADAASFEVVGTSLYIKSGVSLDYETKSSYAVTVNAVDGALNGSVPVTTAYTLTLTDINEAPTAVSLTNLISTIAENTSTSSRIKVADIVITDDALGTETLTLTGADAASFEVLGASLYIKSGVSLDYETKSSYAVTVNAVDGTLNGSVPVTAAYALTLTDINEAPVANTVTVSNAGTYQATSGTDVFIINAASTISATINGFASGDRLEIVNGSTYQGINFATNGTSVYAVAGNAIITLNGLSTTSFAQNEAGFTSQFGSDSIRYQLSEVEAITLYAVNQLRHAPQTWATMVGVTLDKDWKGVTISGVGAKDSLVADQKLFEAALGHSIDMLASGQIYHNNGSDTTSARIAATGYTAQASGENVNTAFNSSQPYNSPYAVAMSSVKDLFNDYGIDGAGHRINLLSSAYADLGVGYAIDSNPVNGYEFYGTQNFGRNSSENPYLTGFVIGNADGNYQYNDGEGLSGVVITITDVTANTQHAVLTESTGYWAFAGIGGHTYNISASGPGFSGTGSVNGVVLSSVIDNGYNSRSVDFFSGTSWGRLDYGVETNNAPTGSVIVSGSSQVGQTLTANTNSISDVDGLGAFNYQWLVDGFAIKGKTLSTLVLDDALAMQVNLTLNGSGSSSDTASQWVQGHKFSVNVAYTDQKGVLESLASAQTNSVIPA